LIPNRIALPERALRPDVTFIEQICPDFWICDNHKWALWAWEQYRCSRPNFQRLALVHADFHWDDIDNVSNELGAEEIRGLSLRQIHELLIASDLEEGAPLAPFIGYDSFIAPALFRGLFREIHFYCLQGDRDGAAELFEQHTHVPQDINLHLHQVPDSLSEIAARPIAFDLCLDLFGHGAEGDTFAPSDWRKDEVLDFLVTSRRLIEEAAVITVSTSFGFSGTVDETRALAQLVFEEMVALRT
jgi:hypothetical protein